MFRKRDKGMEKVYILLNTENKSQGVNVFGSYRKALKELRAIEKFYDGRTDAVIKSKETEKVVIIYKDRTIVAKIEEHRIII